MPGVKARRNRQLAPDAATLAAAARATLIALLALAVIGHAVQVLSPLRLNTDAVLLLRMAEAFVEGRGFRPPDIAAPHPVGYPAVVALLHRAGMDGAAGLAFVNIAGLLAGVWASARAVRRGMPARREDEGPSPAVEVPRLVAVLTLFSWVIIKHAPIPISDTLYFAFSSITLLVLIRAGESASAGPRAAWLALGAAMIAGCVLLRTVGLALIPAMCWAAATPAWRARILAGGAPARRAIVAGVLVGGGLAAAALAAGMRTRYWSDMLALYGGESAWHVARLTAEFRLRDLGEILLNAPRESPPPIRDLPFAAAGAAAHAMLALGLWAQRRAITPPTVYLAAYSGIILVWPYTDARFYLPVVPFLLGAWLLALRPIARFVAGRWVIGAWMLLYVVLGAAALGYSTGLSFAGERFTADFGSGDLAPSYRAAYGQPHEPGVIDPHAERMIRRHDPTRARPPLPGR